MKQYDPDEKWRSLLLEEEWHSLLLEYERDKDEDIEPLSTYVIAFLCVLALGIGLGLALLYCR